MAGGALVWRGALIMLLAAGALPAAGDSRPLAFPARLRIATFNCSLNRPPRADCASRSPP